MTTALVNDSITYPLIICHRCGRALQICHVCRAYGRIQNPPTDLSMLTRAYALIAPSAGANFELRCGNIGCRESWDHIAAHRPRAAIDLPDSDISKLYAQKRALGRCVRCPVHDPVGAEVYRAELCRRHWMALHGRHIQHRAGGGIAT